MPLEFLIVAAARHDVLQRQAFILGKVQVVDLRSLDVLLDAADEVLEKAKMGLVR